ncbi:MAG: DNA primase, partial [Sphingomonadales bacterium]
MTISPEFLDELRARLSLAEIVGRKVKLRRQGREHAGLCPFHNEKTPSFTVSEDKQFYHCFGCGAHGDAIRFVTETEGLSFPEAVEKLAGQAGLVAPPSSPAERAREQKRASLADVVEIASDWFESQLATAQGGRARDYLARRGLDPATIRKFRIGFAPDRRTALKSALSARDVSERQLIEAGLLIAPDEGGESYDRFRNRIMFPIADRRGRIVAFGGRTLGEARAKYLNSPETALFTKGRLLYNLHGARAVSRNAGTVIAVEGYMDVIALAQAGFEHAVAPLGTAITEHQLHELWRLAAEPVLCFDGDKAGLQAGYRALERALALLKPGHSLRFAFLPPDEDPDSLIAKQGARAFAQVIEAALPLSEVLWRSQIEGAALDTPERRAGFQAGLEALVARIGDPKVRTFYRTDMARRLANLFGPQAGQEWRPPRAGGGWNRRRRGSFKPEVAPGLRPETRRKQLGPAPAGSPGRRERLLVL